MPPAAATSFRLGGIALFIAAIVLVIVGIALAANLLNVAETGAAMNLRLGGLQINSQAATWRWTGAILIAVGIPLAVWAGVQIH